MQDISNGTLNTLTICCDEKFYGQSLIDALFSCSALLVMRKELYSPKCGVQTLNILCNLRYLIRSLANLY